MSDLLDSLQDMVAFKHDDMSVAKEAIDHIETQAARIAKLEAALLSIASNTCCDRCQEAALVARAALKGGEKDGPA